MGQLGDTLRAKRIALGITIAQAEQQTRIRGKLLEAIEEGDYGRLPNPGYVRGYVSSYARFLDLDSTEILEMYWKEIGRPQVNAIHPPREAVRSRHQQHAIPWRVGLIAAVVVLLVALGLWLAFRPRTASTTLPIPNTAQSTTVTQVVPFTLDVSVASNSTSALTVVIDGQSAYSGTLTSGQTKQFQVSQATTLTIGTPSAVTVKRDGASVTIPAGNPAILTLQAEKQK